MFTMLMYENNKSKPTVITVENEEKMTAKKDDFLFGRELTVSERTFSRTSPWMNRLVLGEKYIVVPKVLNHGHDVEKATSDRFVVVVYADNGFAVLNEDGVTEFGRVLEKALLPEEKAKYIARMREVEHYGTMFQYYRIIYAPESDDCINKLRDALQNDIDKCREWVAKLEEIIKAGKSHPKDKEELKFTVFLINTDLRGRFACISAATESGIPDPDTFSLKRALDDPELTKMLIRALEPESIRIIRGSKSEF